jgi:hypothetical protein
MPKGLYQALIRRFGFGYSLLDEMPGIPGFAKFLLT